MKFSKCFDVQIVDKSDNILLYHWYSPYQCFQNRCSCDCVNVPVQYAIFKLSPKYKLRSVLKFPFFTYSIYVVHHFIHSVMIKNQWRTNLFNWNVLTNSFFMNRGCDFDIVRIFCASSCVSFLLGEYCRRSLWYEPWLRCSLRTIKSEDDVLLVYHYHYTIHYSSQPCMQACMHCGKEPAPCISPPERMLYHSKL